MIRWQVHGLRQWDQLSAQRVDHLLANSVLRPGESVSTGAVTPA